ncbi:conserved hypothetical protein [Ricinus communis]|uniref:Uncharacterized protein n=1 Tax=Ricinus communis TaxID=3988 RepID=B9RLE2_RICCO|nr:conserved hypothetical protein [Ricinus communis]
MAAKSSLKLAFFVAALLVIASCSEMVAARGVVERGPVISFDCKVTADCTGAKCLCGKCVCKDGHCTCAAKSQSSLDEKSGN